MPGVPAFEAMIPARDVLHVRMYSAPENPLFGITPIAAAVSAINTNTSISNFQEAFFKRMQRPSGVLSTDQSMTKPQIDELSEHWEKKSKGLDAGGVPILTRGLKWQAMSLSSADAELIAAYRLTVEDIARALRVPVQMIDSAGGTAYNNVEQLLEFWRLSSLGFVVNHIEQALHFLFRLGFHDQLVQLHFVLSVLLLVSLLLPFAFLGTALAATA